MGRRNMNESRITSLLTKKIPITPVFDFSRRPFFILSVFFALGIISASFLNLPFWVLFSLSFIVVLAGIVCFRNNLLFEGLMTFFFFIFGMLFYVHCHTFSAEHIRYQMPDEKKHVFCLGTIIDCPAAEKSQFSGTKTSFKFKLEYIKFGLTWSRAKGIILVNSFQNMPVKYLDEFLLEGDIYKPWTPGNPGEFNYKKFLENNGIFAVFNISKSDLTQRISLKKLSLPGLNDKNDPVSSTVGCGVRWIKKSAFDLRHRLKERIYAHISKPYADVLAGILLGLRENIAPDIEDLFLKTGTRHLLAVSGLHVVLMVTVIMYLLRIINIPRKTRFFLAIVFLLLYVPLTGANVPVIRAAIMAGVVFFGFLLDREADIFNSLGLAALLILMSNPHQIFTAGFQLSFACVLSILFFSHRIEEIISPNEGKISRKLPLYFKKSIAVSLSAWAGTLPLSIYHFNNFSVLGIICNAAAIMLAFLSMVLGVLFLLFGCGFFANILSALASYSIWILLKFLSLAGRLPFGFYRVSRWPFMWTAVFYFGVVFLLSYQKFKRKLVYLVSAGFLMCGFFFLVPLLKKSDDIMRINFFDVGFADAVLIEFPSGGHMLIDAGSFKNNTGENIIAPYLWNKGIHSLEAVVITHPEEDHFGGLNFVLENFKIGTVFDNGDKNDNLLFTRCLEILKKRKIKHSIISASQVISGFDAVSIKVLNPPLNKISGSSSDLNNNSVVLKIEYKNFSLLLTGDIQAEGLRNLFVYKDMLRSDIIKLPHHGLESSLELEMLLDFVQPKAALISAGSEKERKIFKINKILSEKNIKSVNTAESGFVSVETDGVTFKINTYKTEK